MIINILTLFPAMVAPVLQESILKRAIEKGLITVNIIDFRAFAKGKHKQVDDYAFGGSGGMLIKAEPLFDAVDSLEETGQVIYASPQGETLTQAMAKKLAKEPVLTFVAGHYEGIDERFIEEKVDLEISIGDYVLTGGELPILVMVDTISRMIPGVIKENSYVNDSFYADRLDCPHYTRPANFRGLTVPDVLLSGNHAEIEKFRQKEGLLKTLTKRADLVETMPLSKEEEKLKRELIAEGKI